MKLSIIPIVLALTTAMQSEGGPPSHVGGGNISACGAAPGADPSVEAKASPGTSPGNITVTSVTIDGVAVPAGNYTVTGNGTSSPEVTFHAPPPGAPARGKNVCVYGTTSTGDEEFTGVLKW